jgi:PhzF family phenazine biosynthesis protein
METRRTLLVDAFTTDPLTGNAAGVVPNADGLSPDQMRAIAAEIGASETAFVRENRPSDDGDDPGLQLRYFTPDREIDLCGHATVASVAHLFDDDVLGSGTHAVATDAGTVDVEIDPDGTVRLFRPVETVEPVEVDYGRLEEALGIPSAAFADVGADLPAARASIGLPFLVVPVNFLERLAEADPDLDAVEALSESFDVAGVYAFTFDTLEADSTVHARAWAPGIGVPEDPVTGTAAGALGAHLRGSDVFDGDPPAELRLEQGHFVDRPGTVRIGIENADDRISVGGPAVTSLDGDLAIPEPETDEIIEA